MALTVIKPSGIDTSGNYTVTGMNVSANLSVANLTVTTSSTLGAVGNVIITGGTNGYVLQTDGAGNLSWASISAGSGISNGTSNISIPVTNGNINLTAGGNTSLVVTDLGANISGNIQSTGNITAQYFVGNGFYLTGVDTSPANIANGTSNVEVALSGNVTTSVAGNANILTVTGTGIVVSGNATIGVGTGGNLSGVNVVSATTITTSGNISASGNSSAQYFVGNGFYLTGVDTSPANISNGISNVQVYLDSNITMSVAGNANILTVTGTGINVSGNATIGTGTGGNLSGVNVVSANTFTAVANISSGANVSAQYFVGNGFYLTGVDTSPANMTNGTSNVEVALSGNVTTSVAGNANILTVTGTGINVFGNATIGSGTGGNISGANNMSANTFTALSSVNFVSASNVSLGAIGNVKITGGTSSYVLSTDGTGNLSWIAPGSGSSGISNGNSNVNIPAANGNINLTAVGNTVMVITGTGANITGYANVSGNVSAPYFIGNGSLLTGVDTSPANISNGTSNVQVNLNGNVTTSVGTVANVLTITTTGANILGTLNVSGQSNLGAVGNVKITGGISGYVLGTDGAGNLSWVTLSTGSAIISNGNSNVRIATSNGNVTITAVGTTIITATGTGANIAGYANITGNVNAPFFIGNGSSLTGIGGAGYIFNGTSNANISTSGGNLNIGIGGNANIGIFTSTGLNVAGYANVTGNVNAPFFIGNGFYLTGISTNPGNIANGTSNVQVVLNGNVSTSVNGNANVFVVTGTGANVAGTLNATGNVLGGNISTGGQLVSTLATGSAPIIVLSTTQVPNLNVEKAGTVTTAAQPNITSVGTLTSLAVTANTTSGNFIGALANGNSNVNIPTANGNINFSAEGNANIVVITGTGANISGTANITGNLIAGNITAGNITAGSSSNITGANLVSANYFTGTLTTAAQPNISSLGSLTGLTVSNATGVVNFTTTANVSLGAIGNLHITGGSGSQYLQTDGTGNLTWASISTSSTLANGNSNVNLPTANGNINFSAVGNANILVVTGTGANIAGTLNVSEQSNLGNVGNVKITGGSSSQYLQTDGTGNLTWVSISTSSTLANGNSNVNIPSANGNVNFTAGGNTNMVLTATGANITGNLTASGANVDLGSISNLHIAGGTGGYVMQTDGSGNLSWVAQSGGGGGGSSISNGTSNVFVTIDGNVTTSVSGNAGVFVVTGTGANVAGSLNATGNIAFSGPNVALGNVSNLYIPGGSANFVLGTNGSGNLSWIAQPPSAGTPGSIQEFAAANGQTTFTVTGGYTVGSVMVFINGIQMNNADYTASNGSTVVLTEARVSGDVVRILSSIISPEINVNALQNFSVAMSIALGI